VLKKLLCEPEILWVHGAGEKPDSSSAG